MRATVLGDPDPSIQWILNEEPMEADGTNVKVSVYGNCRNQSYCILWKLLYFKLFLVYLFFNRG